MTHTEKEKSLKFKNVDVATLLNFNDLIPFIANRCEILKTIIKNYD